jgi:hypothetical protein
MTEPITPENETLARAVNSPYVWLAAFGKILTKEQTIVSLDGTQGTQLNEYQLKLLTVYEWCMANGVPCRILALKPRQKGSSTVTCGIVYHHCRRFRSNAVQMADRYKNSDNLFAITARYAEQDEFPWDTRFDSKATELTVSKPDGELWSKINKDTAENPKAGRSGTVQVLHVSEAAHFPNNGVKSADKTMLAMLNSLADVPKSVAIVETTANGASGWFYQNWVGDPSTGLQAAVTLDEFIAGNRGNGWIKVFSPWFEFEDSILPLTPAERDSIAATLTEREKYGVGVYEWALDQIAWRRFTISQKCGGREDLFDQEYPEDERKAFLTSGRPRFSMEGLKRVRGMSNHTPKIGFLHLNGEGSQRTVTWERHEAGWAQVWEEPHEGCRYLVWCDTATGAIQTSGSKNPDRHSVLVLRQGYQDHNGDLHNAAVVARIKPPCFEDWPGLEEKTEALSRYYGKCMIGVEIPMGLTLLEGLRRLGMPLFKRRNPGHPLDEGKPGFQTNSATKPLVVSAVSRALDEPSVDIWDAHIVSELETFVTHDDGTEAALTGLHDDDVMALGMGLLNISCATRYTVPIVRRGPPPDLQRPYGAMESGMRPARL